jgi:hypothetical protein
MNAAQQQDNFKVETIIKGACIMSKSDQWTIITIALLIILHLSILANGYFTTKLPYVASVLNLAAGTSIILYGVIRQIQIEQHTIELGEIIILLFEVSVIGDAVFYIVTTQKNNWLKVLQYITFGIHLLALILGLIFMLTFKMNRLI